LRSCFKEAAMPTKAPRAKRYLNPVQVARAQRLLAERNWVLDLEDPTLAREDAVLCDMYVRDVPEGDASFAVALARGELAGDAIEIPSLPPAERRIRLGELGALLASKKAGMVSVTLERPLLLARSGRELVERLREWSEQYHAAMPEAWPEGDREALKACLEKLERSFDLLRESEERLRLLGWKVDEKKGKLTRIAGHAGKRYFAEHVSMVCRSLLQQRKWRGRPVDEKDLSFRKAVAGELRGLFPDEELDFKAGAPLYNAIRHFLERG
jgi:hypothetical protein